jgi:2-keto-4-pentenoate hydratase/2-oxohepta-3-ene-1,7-dioic acid hydratase in catechol pathway
VSARDWQRDKNLGGGQFARGKSFDGFCPLGPAIVTKDEIPQPNNLKIRSILNGQTMQDHTTGDMIFDVPTLIESLSSTLTLRPGAVIMTGTPHGVGFARNPPVWMKPGDTIEIELEKIGRTDESRDGGAIAEAAITARQRTSRPAAALSPAPPTRLRHRHDSSRCAVTVV